MKYHVFAGRNYYPEILSDYRGYMTVDEIKAWMDTIPLMHWSDTPEWMEFAVVRDDGSLERVYDLVFAVDKVGMGGATYALFERVEGSSNLLVYMVE